MYFVSKFVTVVVSICLHWREGPRKPTNWVVKKFDLSNFFSSEESGLGQFISSLLSAIVRGDLACFGCATMHYAMTTRYFNKKRSEYTHFLDEMEANIVLLVCPLQTVSFALSS